MQTPQYFHFLVNLLKKCQGALAKFTVHLVSTLVQRIFSELEICKRTQKTLTNLVIERCLVVLAQICSRRSKYLQGCQDQVEAEMQ